MFKVNVECETLVMCLYTQSTLVCKKDTLQDDTILQFANHMIA